MSPAVSPDSPCEGIGRPSGPVPAVVYEPLISLRRSSDAEPANDHGERAVEPPPAGAGGSPQYRDLPPAPSVLRLRQRECRVELLTREAFVFVVARKRFPPPARAGGCKGAGFRSLAPSGPDLDERDSNIVPHADIRMDFFKPLYRKKTLRHKTDQTLACRFIHLGISRRPRYFEAIRRKLHMC